MKLLELLKQELHTPTIPIVDLKNLNNNIDDYLKYADDLSDKQRETFIRTLVKTMQSISRKLSANNKYESFVRKMFDKDNLDDNLKKLKLYNNKLIKEKQ